MKTLKIPELGMTEDLVVSRRHWTQMFPLQICQILQVSLTESACCSIYRSFCNIGCTSEQFKIIKKGLINTLKKGTYLMRVSPMHCLGDQFSNFLSRSYIIMK